MAIYSIMDHGGSFFGGNEAGLEITKTEEDGKKLQKY